MSEETKLCPKCHHRMAEGFIADRGDSNMLYTSKWYGGIPNKSFWGGVKVAKKSGFQIRTYRCEDCGYLESYAI